MVYAGIGWLVFRERADLPRDLVFTHSYRVWPCLPRPRGYECAATTATQSWPRGRGRHSPIWHLSGGEQESLTLNFSKGAGPILQQYYRA
eukprot:gene4149-3383_t